MRERERELPIQTTVNHNTPFWDKNVHRCRGETEQPCTNDSELVCVNFHFKEYVPWSKVLVNLKDSFRKKLQQCFHEKKGEPSGNLKIPVVTDI